MRKARLARKTEFWLNEHDPTEKRLLSTIANLKAARLFSRVIRDGIRIVCGLLQHDISPLVELYPWTVDAFLARYAPSVQTTSETPKTSRDMSSEKSQDSERLMKLWFEKMELMLEAKGFLSAPTPVSVSTQTGNPIGSSDVQFSTPDLDFDFDLEIKKDEGAAARSSENLRNTLMAMYNGEGVWSSKPPDANKPTRAERGKKQIEAAV